MKKSNLRLVNPRRFTLKTRARPSHRNRAMELHGRHWKFPAIYFSSPHQRLFVMLSSAVRRNEQTLPVFSRWTWASKFPGHVLCVADPTLNLDEEMRLGWYFGTERHDANKDLCRLVRHFAAVLGIPTHSIVIWGSSGGGFGALALARYLEGSTAVAINAQTDALAYHLESAVDLVREKCFSGRAVPDIRRRFASRIDMTHAWLGSAGAKAVLVQNKLDTHHYLDHFQPFWKSVAGSAEGSPSPDGRLRALLYEDPAGHAPETEQMVPEILRLVDQLS